MDRKEAIEVLEFLESCSYVDEFEAAEKEALKMAIGALKQLTSYEQTIYKLQKSISELR